MKNEWAEGSDMECGGLDTAFAQRGSTRWPVPIGAARQAALSKAASSRAHSISISDLLAAPAASDLIGARASALAYDGAGRGVRRYLLIAVLE